MTQEAPLITANEVARRLKVHPETVRRWVREGTLPAVTLPSGTLRFRETDLAKITAGDAA